MPQIHDTSLSCKTFPGHCAMSKTKFEKTPQAGTTACFPFELTCEKRDEFEELIYSAKCPKCGSTKLGFLDIGLDSPIICHNCKEVF